MKDILYKIPSLISEALLVEKGSKFLAYCIPVTSIADFKVHLEKLKAEHPKANHHCFAYRLTYNGETYRANDDGEPSGSAGLPILNQLKSAELTNCAIIVVRYFGGVKLGVSGLITAYRSAADLAIQENSIVENYVLITHKIILPYDNLGKIERIFSQNNVEITSQKFEEKVEFSFAVKRSISASLIDEILQNTDSELVKN